jgi:hypothetical protein
LTASVDEIIAVGDKARALNIKVEISQAKITAFGQELACLELVEREHPRLIERNPNAYISRNIADEFKRAFYDVGSITRLSEPSQKVVFSTHVDRLNNLLRTRGHPEVGSMTRAVARSPNALWTPCIRAPKSVWRDILAGGSQLRSPLPPRGAVTLEADRAPRPRVLEQGADGSMHEIAR